jgi:environmental stress-induced protein Ves
MSLRQLSLTEVAAQPWRNGGGRTRELLAWPVADDWALRISLAEIACDGPFSAFPGVERWFAVVDGAGVRLDFAGRPLAMGPASVPLRFAGEAAPGCTLIKGPTRDLNLMVRRDRGRGWMQRARPGAAAPEVAPCALFTADALVCQFGHRPALAVAVGTLLWFKDDAPPTNLAGPASTRAWWLGFEPTALAVEH